MNETTPDTAEWAMTPYAEAPEAPTFPVELVADIEVVAEELPPTPLVPPAEDAAPPELREAREAMADELEPFFARADELEAQVQGVERRSTVLAETARGHLTAGRRVAPAPAPQAPDAPAHTGVNLNTATPEALNSIGLSGTQAARLIALRDMRGGFSSLDEIDDVRGLPGGLVAQLKRRASVRPA